jgi:hypothetical protein
MLVSWVVRFGSEPEGLADVFGRGAAGGVGGARRCRGVVGRATGFGAVPTGAATPIQARMAGLEAVSAGGLGCGVRVRAAGVG